MIELTPRQQHCLYWVAHGKSSWEIGQILGIAERTANFHITNCCEKLGVNTRHAAVARALQHNLLDVNAEQPGSIAPPS